MSKWIEAITFPTSDKPFKVLPPAAKQTNNKHRWIDVEKIGLEQPLEEYIKRDPFPIPVMEDREFYYGDGRNLDWWLSGLSDLFAIKRILAKYGAVTSPGFCMLDMGCASGRFLRHVLCQQPDWEAWGCDIKLRHIKWICKYLPKRARVFQNTIYPSLPVPDNHLDLISAFSVFTHIDELEGAWLAELRRILKPGGLAYVTIHGDECWKKLNKDTPVYNSIMKMRKHLREWKNLTAEFFRKPMPQQKTVFTWTTSDTYNCNVFHKTEYIHDYWGRFFEVLEIIPAGHENQDVVVLRKN